MSEIRKLKVMGMPVSVVSVAQADGELGCCVDKTMQIELDPCLTDALRTKTLVHELAHLYCTALGTEMDEQGVTLVENIIWLMLTENPKVLEAIAGVR
jgi:hypothetical protein